MPPPPKDECMKLCKASREACHNKGLNDTTINIHNFYEDKCKNIPEYYFQNKDNLRLSITK